MGINTRLLGTIAEIRALNYLKKQGYIITEKNFRCKLGEIDIIAWHKKTLCFIEVKSRTDIKFGFPQEAVTPAKQKRIIKVANYYLNNKYTNLPYPNCRFDVVTILPKKGINIITNAFSLNF